MSKWSVKAPSAQEEISPNLIPLIDIMFLLLLFLMLGADMGQRELEEVLLPKAYYVKEDKNTTKIKAEDRVTINVYHRYSTEVKCPEYAKGETCREETHWRIAVRGIDYKTATDEKFKVLLLQESELGKTNKTDRRSERKVMLRVDASAPYGLVQGIMNACAFAGMYKIECGAAEVTDKKAKKY